MKSHSRRLPAPGHRRGLVARSPRGGESEPSAWDARGPGQPSAGRKEAGFIILPARRAARICARLRRLRPLISWLEGMLGTPGKEQFQLGVKGSLDGKHRNEQSQTGQRTAQVSTEDSQKSLPGEP